MDSTDIDHEPDETRPGWKHRVLGMRAVAAVALATLVLGGVGGAALGAVSDGADQQQGPGGRGTFQLPPGGQGFQPGQVPAPGGLPPGTAPQDDVVPDTTPDTSGSTTT